MFTHVTKGSPVSTQILSHRPPTSLQGVIDSVLARSDLQARRRQDLASACRTIARLVGLPPYEIKVDPAEMRAWMKRLPPRPTGMSSGHCRNTKSRFGQAVALAGATTMGKRSKAVIGPDWSALLSSVPDRYWRSNLSRLARFASTEGASPAQIDNELISQFARVIEQSMVERPKQVVRDTCLAWNRAVQTIAAWPQLRLTVPVNRHDYSMPLTAFPATYVADVHAFLAHLAADDIFAERCSGQQARHAAEPQPPSAPISQCTRPYRLPLG